MLTDSSAELPVKPRVLIADDSRIVRATLIKHIQGMFEFREALDGEEAWDTLLIDPNIRVVITDLTMPKLDGYGLLKRIRGSDISRIRNIPVVVVSGSDEQEERERAKAAGATDLITKGIGTAQLLSRLDILSKLVTTQREFEHSLEVLALSAPASPALQLSTPASLDAQAEKMLANAVRHGRNFVMLHVCIGLKHTSLDGLAGSPPAPVVHAIGQLLQRTIRQTDRVAKTGESEFTLVSGSINFDSARNFAQRICRAIAHANMVKDDRMAFIASCGLVSLSDGATGAAHAPALPELREQAQQRALLGLRLATTGVVGAEEESSFERTGQLQGSAAALPPPVSAEVVPAAAPVTSISFFQHDARGESDATREALAPDLATLAQWIKEGKREQVLQYIDRLPGELRSLVELLLQQNNP